MTACASQSAARKRILFVDDDQDTREMMRALLDDYGYDAVLAASVSDALKIARYGGLALCLIDNWLTRSNGVDLCRQIRAFDSQTPIIFYSGAAYIADIQKGLKAGAQAYLLKPYIDELKPTIERLINGDTSHPRHANLYGRG